MTLFGLSEAMTRLAIFVGLFIVFALIETLVPKRRRRYRRVQRWITNFGILASDYLLLAAVALIVPVAAAATAALAAANGWGLLNQVDWPIWVEWAIALVFFDFVIWGQHLVTHRVPILWRLHRVHHTDEDIDASSAIRFHPIEILLSALVKSAGALLLGPAVAAVVLFEALVNGLALFNHANMRLPGWLDQTIRLLIVTPDMHRVHHSVVRRETDSNFGFGLSIWDRLFRTYVAQPEAGHDKMVLGLSQWQDERPNNLGWTLALPFNEPPRSKPDQ